MFSSRTPDDLQPNRLAAAIADARASGTALVDATVSNPTAVGLDYPFAAIDAAFAAVGGGVYAPDPRGLVSARAVVAERFAGRGAAVSPDDVFLTASTSEAYALVLTLLCDPGDEVLVGAPGYPLFEHLVTQHAAVVRHYAVSAGVDGITAAITPRTRAIIAVSPNNPSGHVRGRRQLDALAAACAERGVALICDEVFCDYDYTGATLPSAAACTTGLVFALDGLSKSCAMPQLKLAWLACAGDPALRRRAAERLDLIADTRLSVSAHVQRALPALLALGARLRAQIHHRLAKNRALISDALAPIHGARLLPATAGWYGVVELPAGHTDERMCLDLVGHHGVIAQPGYFYDYGRDDLIVLSLLAPPESIDKATTALVALTQ